MMADMMWWKGGSASVAVAMLAVAVLSVAILIQTTITTPHRDLDWEGSIVPMAQAYAREHANNATNDTSASSSESHQMPPLQGIHVLITGATNGIGLSLTRALTKLGACVIAVGRSKARLEALQAELGSVQIIPVQADLADLSSVARAADELLAMAESSSQSSPSSLDKIDILINNAGMHDLSSLDTLFGWKNFSSPQGYDRVFAVNYLSHFLLTEKLATLVGRSSRPTVVQISSSFHWAVDGSDLVAVPAAEAAVPSSSSSASATTTTTTKQLQPPVASQPGGSRGFFVFRSQRSYANSKLAQLYHARSLQKFHPVFNNTNNNTNNKKTRVVSVCPAFVATQIAGAPGSVSHSLVHAMAYPADGWGLASTLLAIFDDNNDNNDQDYYTNTDFVNIFGIIFARFLTSSPWTYRWGLRDCLAGILAGATLLGQRFLSNAAPSASSPESYDEAAVGDALYQWSYQAVSSYL